MKTKKRRKLFLVIATLLILLLGIGAIIVYNMSQLSPTTIYTIKDIDLTKVPDGTYTGSAENGLVKVKVSITTTDGKITDIELLQHDNGLGKKAESITADVINEQSLDVDAVSSATYSSTTILKAIENALTD